MLLDLGTLCVEITFPCLLTYMVFQGGIAVHRHCCGTTGYRQMLHPIKDHHDTQDLALEIAGDELRDGTGCGRSGMIATPALHRLPILMNACVVSFAHHQMLAPSMRTLATETPH